VSAVQLHGPAFPPLDRTLKIFKLIRAVAVTGEFQAASLQGLRADAFLLDAFDTKLLGGTGKPFNWAVAREASRLGTIILAGGLTPENVGQAIREVRPFAVDVASGVEREPGVKDENKLRAFFQEVERADRETKNGI
jgi:phosphoribosylanthranilate isomerase